MTEISPPLQMQPAKSKTVAMKRPELIKVKDSLERTNRAVKQVASYFKAGASAFDEESTRISESLQVVTEAISQADLFGAQ